MTFPKFWPEIEAGNDIPEILARNFGPALARPWPGPGPAQVRARAKAHFTRLESSIPQCSFIQQCSFTQQCSFIQAGADKFMLVDYAELP